jgi:hypothetical protein
MMLLMLVICKQRMLPIFMHDDAADAFDFDEKKKLGPGLTTMSK